MKTNKIVKITLLLIVLIVIVSIVGKKAGWFGKDLIVKVTAEKPQRRTITELITANGKVQPEMEVKISPEVSGEIVELYVKEGDEVKEGQLLLKIKPDTYQANLERMKAALNSSKSNLATSKSRLAQSKSQFTQAELTYQRNKKLYEQGAISQSDYEKALSSYEVAKADVESAQESINSAVYAISSSEASLKEAQQNLTKTTIYAPMSGTVSKLNIEKGERVVGTAQMAGTELLRIANLNKMEVTVSVNENDIVRVKHGDTALIEVDAYLDHKFKGIVSEIANSANVSGSGSDQVTNFDVKILVLKESYNDLIPKDKANFYPFRPGMSATVDIQTKQKINVLSIPVQAVTTRQDSTLLKNQSKKVDTKKDDEETPKVDKNLLKEVVFVNRNGVLKQCNIKTGIQNSNFIEIVEGISENDEVITAPYSLISKTLSNGTKVKIVKTEELFKE